ncbi:MAG: RHS repeat-associated core domain-containing protein, partial [bacterium]
TGHERDRESGLDYMVARYYSSSLGRFMAVDPGDDTEAEDPQSWNRYAYVGNNPLAYADPDGTSGHSHMILDARRAANSPGGKEFLSNVERTAKGVSKVASTIAVASTAGAIPAFVLAGPAGAAPAVKLGSIAGKVSVVADGVALAANPTLDNAVEFGKSAATAGLGKGVQTVGKAMGIGEVASEMVGNAAGEGLSRASQEIEERRADGASGARSGGHSSSPGSSTNRPGGTTGGRKQPASAVDRKAQEIKDKVK